MVEVFRLVREVLADDGTCWINLGDCYAHGPTWAHREQRDPSLMQNNSGWTKREQGTANTLAPGLKPKDLCGIPWRIAFALQANGWTLRQDIIWAKPSPMPESVTDRCTKSHEYLFLLSKSPRYYFDAHAIREEAKYGPSRPRDGIAVQDHKILGSNGGFRGGNRANDGDPSAGRNRRSVWTIASEAFPDAHFATFARKLVEPCVLAGTSERGHCPECGKRWERLIESTRPEQYSGKSARWGNDGNGMRMPDKFNTEHKTLGFRATCDHGHLEPIPDIVLDPFGGTGTVGRVAQDLGRRAILIELSPAYAAMAKKRTAQTGMALST